MPTPYRLFPTYKSTDHVKDFLSGRDLISSTDPAIVGDIDPVSAFARVAWLSRGVKLIARHVARFPHALMRGETDVTDAPEFAELNRRWYDLLFRAEASLSLTGAGYWLLEANEYGLNVTPRWVLSQSMRPVVDRERGLVRFERNNQPVLLDDMVHFWEPSFTSEIAPGVGAAQTALSAASQLYAMDAFVAQFFNQGAVKVTVFGVPRGTPDAEVERFQSFLKRRISGVRNAFQNIVMSLTEKLTPTVIGSDIKDTQAAELINIQRDNVAVALEIPPSVIDGTSANFATAQNDYFGFVTGTIIPRVEWLYEIITTQYLSRFDVELVAQPERLEVMQSAQLEQAKTLFALTDEAILTVDEARAYMELGPKPREAKPEPPPAPVIINSPAPARSEMTAEEIAAMMGKWRRAHLDALQGGVYYSALPFKAALPGSLYEAVAGELAQASGAGEAQGIFERHWPGKSRQSTNGDEPLGESALLVLAAEVRAARRAIEA